MNLAIYKARYSAITNGPVVTGTINQKSFSAYRQQNGAWACTQRTKMRPEERTIFDKRCEVSFLLLINNQRKS